MVLSIASAASAQTLYNNLPPAVTIGNYYDIAGGNQPDAGPLYNSFSTGSSNVLLTDVKVYLERMAAPLGAFNMALWTSLGDYPNTEIQGLGAMNDTAVSTSGGVYDFPVNPGVQLTANTRYFIELYATNSGAEAVSTYWASTDSTSGTGNVGGEYNCFEGFFNFETPASVRGARPHGTTGLGCFSNTEANDPFIMEVTAGPQSTASAPDLTLPGMAVLSILLAVSAILLQRRQALR